MLKKMEKKDSTASFYNKGVVHKRCKYFASNYATDNTTRYLIASVIDRLQKLPNCNILDLGTGNGFVLTEIANKIGSQNSTRLYGIDLSKYMVEEANNRCKGYPNISILEGDNYSLPFKNDFFDIITNKVVTNLSLSEVYRTLKKGGWFMFKEYSLGKGMEEIVALFKNRVKTKDPLEYIITLRKLGDRKSVV